MANAESVGTSTAAQAQRQRPHSRRHSLRYGLQEPLDVTVLRSGVPDSVPGRSLNLGRVDLLQFWRESYCRVKL